MRAAPASGTTDRDALRQNVRERATAAAKVWFQVNATREPNGLSRCHDVLLAYAALSANKAA